MTSKDAVTKALEDAEKKARLNDLNNKVNLSNVVEQEKKANAIGFGLYKIKNINKTPFVQVFFQNITEIQKKQYLTNAESSFILNLMPFISMGSNAIKNPDNEQFMTISDIAKKTFMQRETASRLMKSLIEKGIILELVNVLEIKKYLRNVNSRPLFMNPEIIYMGDKNRIDPMLCDMIMEYDTLEKNKILLKAKVWHSTNSKSGRLVSRETYLKYKREKGIR